MARKKRRNRSEFTSLIINRLPKKTFIFTVQKQDGNSCFLWLFFLHFFQIILKAVHTTENDASPFAVPNIPSLFPNIIDTFI